MKNKKAYKHWESTLIDIVISAILTYFTVIIIRGIIIFLYRYTAIQLINNIINLWRYIREMYLDGVVYLVFGAGLFIIFYLLVKAYRRNKSLENIINETEIMANGNLDGSINIEEEGDIKRLAYNINSISKQLKDRTIEERKAQQTKTDLITNVSHDLRTPLTSIMGYLEIIDNDQYEDEVRLRYYANIAYEKSKSLSILINDLFELTKMQNNTINLNKREINLVELLGQVVAYFECQFKRADMESRIDFSDDKLIVSADAEKLVRAFENLLSNAIKYGRDGHYVDVTTKLEDNMAVIQVINYGKSISSIDLPYIFDRFYRVEKSRNSDIGGSGLGLAITKNIIELHEGSIEAYSDDSRTIFEVRLKVLDK